MFVKPTINPETGELFRIRQPERLFIVMPPEGAEVPVNHFYLTHVRDGALEVVAPPSVVATHFGSQISAVAHKEAVV